MGYVTKIVLCEVQFFFTLSAATIELCSNYTEVYQLFGQAQLKQRWFVPVTKDYQMKIIGYCYLLLQGARAKVRQTKFKKKL